MVFQCYTWILDVFNQIIGDGHDHDHDDSESNERLIALPAQTIGNIFNGQNICKKWQRLISWSGCGSHGSRDKPLILRYFCTNNNLRVSIIDGKSENECKAGGLKSIKSAQFVGVCNGLALFTSYNPHYRHIVFNPLSKEKMTTIYPPYRGSGDLCGFFFHPVAKEYRILSVKSTGTDDNYEYRLYLFGQKVWRRTANPYFSCKPANYRNSIKRPGGNPAIVNNALHWPIRTGIMVFDIISEEFSVRYLPFQGFYPEGYLVQHLLVKDGQLCLCRVGFEEPVMDIWILKDYSNWSWVCHKFSLDWDLEMFPIKEFIRLQLSLSGIRVISIQNNKLVLFWRHRGMFSYDLGRNTVKKLPLKRSKMDCYFDELFFRNQYDYECGFEAYSSATISD